MCSSIQPAASRGFIDAVIEPGQPEEMIHLRHQSGKQELWPERRNHNMPIEETSAFSVSSDSG